MLMILKLFGYKNEFYDFNLTDKTQNLLDKSLDNKISFEINNYQIL